MTYKIVLAVVIFGALIILGIYLQIPKTKKIFDNGMPMAGNTSAYVLVIDQRAIDFQIASQVAGLRACVYTSPVLL